MAIVRGGGIRSNYCVIVGGYWGKLFKNSDYSVVIGGWQCATNPFNVGTQICEYSFLGGGYLARIYDNSYCVIIAGRQNQTSGDYGCQIGGLYHNVGDHGFGGTGLWQTIDGTHGVALNGYRNTSTGDKSVVVDGRYNSALADYSTILSTGLYGLANLYGEKVHVNNRFGTVDGTAQTSTLVARNQTDNATPLSLFLDGTSEQLVMPEDMTWLFNARITGHRDDATESATYQIQGVVRRAGTSDPVLVGSSKTVLAEDDTNWDANVQVDTTNDALEFTVTGASGKTINWVARIELVSAGT